MSDLELVKNIFELCSEKMNDRFNSFSQLKNSSLHETEDDSGLSVVDHRSEVLLYGADITIRLQLFYNCKFFSTYLKNIYDDVTQARVIDFFNEVGNLTGGKVKEVFIEQGITAALSLPMNIGTTKAKIVQGKESLSNHKLFESRYENQSIYMAKVSIEIHSSEKFSNFDKDFSRLAVQEGEVDFF